MYIVSKFHDYYDTATAYGIDKTCVYDRTEAVVEIKRGGWNGNSTIRLPNGDNFIIDRIYGNRLNVYMGNTVGEVYIQQRIVAFCGQFYPMVKICPRFTGKTFYFYSAQEFNEFVTKEGLFRNKSRFRYFSPRWDKHNLEYEQGVKEFFGSTHAKEYETVFHSFRVPCFVFGGDNVVLNPSLKDYGFMKVKDPQTAFQDIYMFISGVIGAPPKPKEKMSDKVLAAAKGHDGKYSFKKPPGKRGRKQWR